MEFNSQEEAEAHYQKEGWQIIKPVLINDGTCQHVWEKISDNDYQCKCGQGFIGNPHE